MRKITHFAAALLVLPCAACSEPSLYPVTGKVDCNGLPAAGAIVLFQSHAAVGAHSIVGTVQSDGSFEMLCGAWGKGVPPGDYDVLIAWRCADPTAKGCCERRTDKLAGRYSDPAHPRFRVTIKPETNVLVPFELTD